MKLLAYTIQGQTIGIDIGVWDDAMLSGNTAFMAIADTGSTPTDYVDISSIVNWDAFGSNTTLTDIELRIEITKLVTLDPTPEEIEILINWGILIDTDIISGQTGTFWGNFRVEGTLWVETIRRVKQEARTAYYGLDQLTPLGGSENNLSGLELYNITDTGNTTAYVIGVNKNGQFRVGTTGNTQPIMTGTSAPMVTYNTTSSGGATTTSATDVLMTGAQLTGVPAGNYFLSFGTSLQHSSNGAQTFTTIYVGGAAVAGSEQEWRRGTAQGDVATTHNYAGFPITLASTANVEIRWRTSSATATSTNRYISLIKVG